MTCMCAFAQSTAMATTQLTRVVQCRAIQHNDAASWQSHNNREKKLRMSWIVVTDNDGRRQLQIHWEPATGGWQPDSDHNYNFLLID